MPRPSRSLSILERVANRNVLPEKCCLLPKNVLHYCFQLFVSTPPMTGVHPHEAKSWRSSTFDRLEYLARQPGCVAIGECGLDFNRDYSPRDQQLDVFEKQVVRGCIISSHKHNKRLVSVLFSTTCTSRKHEAMLSLSISKL